MATDPHATDPHATDDHGGDEHAGDEHGHDVHGNDAEPLGPLDVRAWAAGAVGVAVGLVVTYAFVLAIS